MPFDNIPAGAHDVQVFDKIHSPLFSVSKFVKNGCQLFFDTLNTQVVNGTTGIIKSIIKEAENNNSNDIIMTIPFDDQTLTWKIDANGMAKPMVNITNNVH